jgi:uncharacterized protein (DUF2249 family)
MAETEFRMAETQFTERLLDVRDLEPPEPLERVLAELETLAPHERIRMVHRRDPHMLYPILEREHFAHRTLIGDDGLVQVLIWHRQAGG